VLANKSVSTDVIHNIRYIFASQREFKPRNTDADIPKDLFLLANPEFRKSWSRLDEKLCIAILHCKAGTGKKNHELQV
jgi:ABC-type sulfate transport system substrate-binding protein